MRKIKECSIVKIVFYFFNFNFHQIVDELAHLQFDYCKAIKSSNHFVIASQKQAFACFFKAEHIFRIKHVMFKFQMF
jgi:hypothetical protein